MATLTDWSNWGWPLLANHLWQATLFSLIVFVATRLLGRAPASARYYVWLIALMKFALPSVLLIFLVRQVGLDTPALTRSVAQPSPVVSAVSPILSPVPHPVTDLQAADPAVQGAGSSAVIYTEVSREGNNLYSALTCVWLSGCALLLASWWRRRRQLSAALKAGRLLVQGREVEALRRVQNWLGNYRNIRLMVTPAQSGPGVRYVWRPVIVVPEGIADQMDDGELEAILMHEVSHVERWDNLTGNLQSLLCCLFWFHPLVWLIDRRLLSEREQACDDAVIRLGGAPNVYASSIAKVCRHCVGADVAGVSRFAGSDLRKRIGRILSNRAGAKLSLPQLMIVAGTAAAAVTISVAAGDGRESTGRDRANVRGNLGQITVARPALGQPGRPDRESGAGAQAPEVASKQHARAGAPSPTEPIRTAPEAPVEVRASVELVESSAPELNSTIPPQPPAAPPPPEHLPAEPAATTTRAAIVKATEVEYGDLGRFVGRYEVDSAKTENFVLDVSLEGDDLWLKPSHARKRPLIRQSETEFSDSFGDFRFTAILDDRDQVVGLRLDSWGRNVTARKLALPAPSLAGNTTFRLKGYRNARVVAVAGTFNNWNQSQLLFAREGGEWVCRVDLPPGTHQYKFIVDGNWLTDPNNPATVHDERGFLNSLLTAD